MKSQNDTMIEAPLRRRTIDAAALEVRRGDAGLHQILLKSDTSDERPTDAQKTTEGARKRSGARMSVDVRKIADFRSPKNGDAKKRDVARRSVGAKKSADARMIELGGTADPLAGAEVVVPRGGAAAAEIIVTGEMLEGEAVVDAALGADGRGGGDELLAASLGRKFLTFHMMAELLLVKAVPVEIIF